MATEKHRLTPLFVVAFGIVLCVLTGCALPNGALSHASLDFGLQGQDIRGTSAPGTNVIAYTSGELVRVQELHGEWLKADYDAVADLAGKFTIVGTTLEVYTQSTDGVPSDTPTIYPDRDADPADGRFFLKAVTPDADGNAAADTHSAAEGAGDALTVWFSPTPGVQPDPDADQRFTYTRQQKRGVR